MVCNIRVLGVGEPVIVRRNGDDIEVVDGRGRTRAALEANRRLTAEGKKPLLIPVITHQGSDADLFGVSISLNEIRRDDSPMAKSEKARRLQDMGYTPQQIAITFGVARQTVHNWLSLQDLDPTLQEAVEKEEMSATAAAAFSGFSREEQAKRLDDLKQQGQPMTVATARRAAKSADNVPAPRIKNRREVEQELQDTDDKGRGEDGYGEYWKGYRDALFWALGKIEDESKKPSLAEDNVA